MYHSHYQTTMSSTLHTTTSTPSLQHRELELKSKQVCEGINKTLHQISNEPTLGLYRVQQHVHKSLPKTVAINNQIKADNEIINGLNYDAKTAIEVVENITKTQTTFDEIENLLKKSGSLAAQVNMRNKPVFEKS